MLFDTWNEMSFGDLFCKTDTKSDVLSACRSHVAELFIHVTSNSDTEVAFYIYRKEDHCFFTTLQRQLVYYLT